MMKTVAKNRRARFDYEILETVEAGVVLTGQEVKSCRMGHADLSGAYISFLHDKPVLKQTKISPYPFASGIDDYQPGRDRDLLLKKSESARLQEQSEQKGIAIIPMEILAGHHIKILLGIGRGRKTIDKRQAIKDREMGKKIKKGEEY
jgi:SsrA-binding protein